MLKKIILLLLTAFIYPFSVNADFDTRTTFNGSSLEFTKEYGTSAKIYKVYEDYLFNPFYDNAITQVTSQINGVTNNVFYRVDGINANVHTEVANAGYIYKEPGLTYDILGFTEEFNDGFGNIIRTKMEYLENAYTRNAYNNKVPKQEVMIRKYYEVTFSYDITPPTCGNVELYEDKELNFPYNTTNLTGNIWLSEPIYYTIQCGEEQIGVECYCEVGDNTCMNKTIDGEHYVYSAPVPVGHLAQPEANFTNTLNLNNVNDGDGLCTGELPGITNILYDARTPSIDFAFGEYFNISSLETSGETNYFNSNDEGNRIYDFDENGIYDGVDISGKNFYTLNDRLYNLAGKTKLTFSIIDPYAESSSNGVSGIKSYNINISNSSGEKICSKTDSFTIYNNNGLLTTSDEKLFTIDCDGLVKTGNYKLVANSIDFAGNETKVTSYFAVYPNHNLSSSSFIELVSNPVEGSSIFANNIDKYSYILNLKDEYDNIIYDIELININQDCSAYNGCKTITTDMTNNTGKDAILETWSGIISSDGKINFSLKSLVPGVYTQGFVITLNKWDNKYNNTSENQEFYLFIDGEKSFAKPIIGNMYVSNDNGETYTGIPEIGTTQRYKININNIGVSDNISGRLYINDESIINLISGHIFQEFTVLENLFNLSNNDFNSYFSTRINAVDNVLEAPNISSFNLPISYRIGGEIVKYYLDDFTISGEDLNNLGVKIVGTLQGGGKASITGQEENFSDLSASDLRGELKKNVYNLIKGINSGDIVNQIKYIKANGSDIDLSLFDLDEFETLVIEDGNLIISENINNTLGIFVLNNNLGNISNGNVYIKSNVTYIDSIIYTDGSLISINKLGNILEIDNNERTAELQNQLIFKGTLFTRNTIGGAILGSEGKYLLPGGEQTTDFDKAMLYDLNYVRRGKVGCEDVEPDGIGDGICDLYNEYFILIYNPVIQTNPPKGFSVN